MMARRAVGWPQGACVVGGLLDPAFVITHWERDRHLILARDGHRCVYCDGRATCVDHVIPRRKGGLNIAWNLVACCGSCNTIKSNTIYDWAIAWRNRWERWLADREAALWTADHLNAGEAA